MLCLKTSRAWTIGSWQTSRGFADLVTPAMLATAESEVEALEDANEAKERILRIRNKSGLKDYHRRQLHDEAPYEEPVHRLHNTLKFHQKMYGTYGAKSGVDPRICWPTKEALKEIKEYESIAYPFTLSQMVDAASNKKLEEQKIATEREKSIELNLSKLDKWKEDLRLRIEKKEALANASKTKKEKLVEEVRRHFGFKINPKDERFQNLLAEKEKQQKKADKQAKTAARDKQIILKLQKMNAEI